MNLNVNGGYSSIEQVTNAYFNHQKVNENTKKANESSFQEVFASKTQSGLKFSKHAGERLATRKIELTDEQLKRLEDGASRASEKGITESLMLMDNMAFIVNVKNHTVITAMDQSDNKENIFTNIDGAVII